MLKLYIYILTTPDNLLFGFLSYFFTLILFFFTRFYIFSRKLIILVTFNITYLILQYILLYLSNLQHNLNIYFDLINFTQNIGIIDFSLSFQLNSLTYLFSFLVLVIAFCTNLYALNYFKNEADEMGFLFWLNCFVLSMIVLVLSSNFLTLFLGWELIGFTSFFLINFWQSRRSTLKSSFKAFTFNLVSDLLLLAALITIYLNLHTTSIQTAFNLVILPGINDAGWVKFTSFCLIGCASIKSVQILGHLWLPDSMEAPVPASSLIHSATLVSAGIFLLLRFNNFVLLHNWLILSLGCITAAYGGVVAAAQTDVKKLLAYSTMSHCGFLFILVSFGDCYITIVYLFLHGLFKASTFFCVGSFIRYYGTQDTRMMGNGARLLWGDTLLLIFCAINLCGLPLTVGFSYKYFFFKTLFYNYFNFLHIGLIYIALLSSLIYFYRLIFYSIFDSWKNLLNTSPLIFHILKPRGYRRLWMHKDYFRNSRITTFSIWYSLFFLVTFAFYVYFNIFFYNSTIFRNSDFIDTYYLKSNLITNYFLNFYNIYLIYFYLFYIIIFIMLSLFTWRKNFYFYNKLNFYTLLLVGFTTFVFVLTCEVQF